MAEMIAEPYFGEKAKEKKNKILRSVAKGKVLPGLYLITFAKSGRDQLDMLPSENLALPFIRDHLPAVVGFALGRKEALDLVVRIAAETFRNTGNCDMRAWLAGRMRESGEERAWQ